MARIRSIKPDFWTDGKIIRLSDTTALFFIALWNHCDDSGYFTLDSLELSMKMPRWRSQDVMKLLRTLHRSGMVALSQHDGVGMVVSWHHQRIDKPRSSKWKDKQIQWDTIDDSSNGIESSSNVRRKDRIGKDRIGKDRILFTTTSKEVAVVDEKNSNHQKELNKKIWESYCTAYFNRYAIEPVRNARVNGQISNLGKRLGEDAIEVVAFYVLSNHSFYVGKSHSIGLCLNDAESLHTQWRKGHAITQSDIREFEKKQAKIDAVNSFSLDLEDERNLLNEPS